MSQLKEMFHLAKEARKKSYSPYSNFPVGVCILGGNNKLYSGANMENAAFPEGWCAETTAIAAMIMDGCNIIKEILVVGTENNICSPCGGCRQKIREFAQPDKCLIHLAILKEEKIVKTYTLQQLLPEDFGPTNLQ